MATGPTNGLIRHIRRAALLHDARKLTDGQLLARFLSDHEEAAFEALLRRHGPMVLGVCRRVLGNAHDAEDAFQATFLVLVRKAATIRPRGAVGNWLYGVAYRTALEARAAAARRRKKERQAADMAGRRVSQGDAESELREVLDHELARLPDAYRAAVVLCDLEGKSHREAARQLGCPEGTVASRLSRARKLLARRLTRRGIALTAGSLAMELARPALTAPVSPTLAVSTLKAAAAVAAGKAAATGAVSIGVISLTEGVLKAMFLTKLKAVVPAVLAAGVLLGGLTVVAFPPGAAGQPASLQEGRPARDREVPPRPVGPTAGSRPPQPAKLQLPTGPAPVQALASMGKDGRVTLRMAAPVLDESASVRGRALETVYGRAQFSGSFQSNQEIVTTYRRQETATTYRRGEVKVLDTHGVAVDWAFLPKLLDKEVVAVAFVGNEVDPRHLRIIKGGTLVFVIPHPKQQPGALKGAGQEFRTEPGGGPGARPADGATGRPPGNTGLPAARSDGAAGDRRRIGVTPAQSPPAQPPNPVRRGRATTPPDAPARNPFTPSPTTTPPVAPPAQREKKPDSGGQTGGRDPSALGDTTRAR